MGENFKKYKNLVLITQIGIQGITPIIIGVLLGVKLDEKFQTSGVFSITFIILASITAIFNIYKLAIKRTNKKDGSDEELDNENNK